MLLDMPHAGLFGEATSENGRNQKAKGSKRVESFNKTRPEPSCVVNNQPSFALDSEESTPVAYRLCTSVVNKET